MVAAAIAAGLPTVAECAGLLYLCRCVDGAEMVGALDAEATMTPRLTLRYRQAVVDHDHLLAPAGSRVTAHDFHRTTVVPAHGDTPAWLVDGEPVWPPAPGELELPPSVIPTLLPGKPLRMAFGSCRVSVSHDEAGNEGFGVDALRALLEWEHDHGDRPPYVTMLSNRIATVAGT